MSSAPTSHLRSLIVIAATAIFLMSFVPVLIRWTSANEATIGIVRLSIALLGILIWLKSRNSLVMPTPRQWRWLICLGLVFGVHWYAYFRSIKLADASLAAIGVATFGIHLLLLNALFHKQKIRPLDLIAVLMAFAGIVITSPSASLDSSMQQGFLLAIFSGFLYACLPLINGQLSELSTNMRALGQFGFALIVFLFLLPEADFNLSNGDWLSLIVLGIVCTLLAHTLWIKASTELPAKFTAVIYYAYVPLTMLYAWLFLNEAVTLRQIAGACLIIAANLMVVMLHRRSQKTTNTPAD